MHKDKRVKIQQLESLEPTAKLSAEVTPLIERPMGPIGLPPDIYRQYGQRQFRLMREAKERIKGILLDMDAWNVLWQIDGRRTVAEVADNLMMPLDTVIYHVECLKLMAIICPVGAVYLPEFILDKTEKKAPGKKRRKNDSGE